MNSIQCPSFYIFLITISSISGILLGIKQNISSYNKNNHNGIIDKDLINKNNQGNYNNTQILNETIIKNNDTKINTNNIINIDNINNLTIDNNNETINKTIINNSTNNLNDNKNNTDSNNSKKNLRNKNDENKNTTNIGINDNKPIDTYEIIDEYNDNSTDFLYSNFTIPVCYGLNNKYSFQALVSMSTIMDNKFNSTFIDFILLVSPGFSNKNKENFEKFCILYNNGCRVRIFDMGNEFSFGRTGDYIPVATYYRFQLPELIKEYDKIIYLDGDDIVFTDLRKMYNISIDNNTYVLGILDMIYEELNSFFGISSNNYINAGTLLLNLKSMRKNNFTEKYKKFVIDNYYKLDHHDQTALNAMCVNNIKVLPVRYGIFCFKSVEDLKKGYNKKISKPYDDYEITRAWYYPVVMHFAGHKKPWNDDDITYRKNIWRNLAKKCKFYNDYKNSFNFDQ